jgi:Fibronectin type III domain
VPPTQAMAPQPGFSPPSVPPSAGVSRRRRPPLWTLIVGVVVLGGLAVGLVVWAPWSPSPQAPTGVRVSSPTAMTAQVSWTAPKGGATPDQYDIMRDGKEQGIVPGTQTSWTDTGLTPGSKHSYTVITVGNGRKSAPSVTISVTTITPPPVDVTATDKTYTTVTLHWSPPPNAPTPSLYTIYDTSTGKHVLDSVDGSQTSYTVAQLIPGDNYSLAVTANWGSTVSALSQSVHALPLSRPLSGTVPVSLKVTTILPQSTGLTVGETWTDNWNFSARCQAASCTLTGKGSLVSTVGQFTATLTPVNGGYQGQAAHAQFSHCDGVNSYETVILRIYADSGGVSNGAWTSWHGTMTLAYPGQSVDGGSCAGGDWGIALTGTGS